LTWRGAASVRIKLKVPATLHNATITNVLCTLAISIVWFLYGLPTYTLTRYKWPAATMYQTDPVLRL